MGLVEKRMLAQLRDEIVPKYQAELREITGNKIVYDVDFDSFANSLTAMGNMETKCLKPLGEVFRAITVDDLGKDAVRQNIKVIKLSHGDATSSISNFTLQNGVLTMPWDWEGWAGSFYPDSVREKIESML